MKVRELIKYLEANGWSLHRQGKGDHRIYRHPTNPTPITINGGANHEIPRGTLRNGILKPAGLPDPRWPKKKES